MIVIYCYPKNPGQNQHIGLGSGPHPCHGGPPTRILQNVATREVWKAVTCDVSGSIRPCTRKRKGSRKVTHPRSFNTFCSLALAQTAAEHGSAFLPHLLLAQRLEGSQDVKGVNLTVCLQIHLLLYNLIISRVLGDLLFDLFIHFGDLRGFGLPHGDGMGSLWFLKRTSDHLRSDDDLNLSVVFSYTCQQVVIFCAALMTGLKEHPGNCNSDHQKTVIETIQVSIYSQWAMFACCFYSNGFD